MINPPDLEVLKIQHIQSVIRFYHEDFTEYYAAVIALTETFPEQINNEIRNAFSHLARVNAAVSHEEVLKEAEKAKQHIERACRDCLKASIIAVRDNIANQFNHALIRYQAIDPKNAAERKAIQQERIQLLKAETNGVPELTVQFKALLERCLALQEDMEEHYGTTTGKISMWGCVFWRTVRDGLKSGVTKLVILTGSMLAADALNLIDMLKTGWHNLTGL